MQKKGVSDVVATVLIIVLTIVAISVVWIGVMPIIKNNLGVNDICSNVDISISTSQGFTCYQPNGITSVQVDKGSKEVNVSGLKFFLLSGGNSVQYTKDFTFTKGASASFFLNSSAISKIDRLEVVPIVRSGNVVKDCPKTYVSSVSTCGSAGFSAAEIAQVISSSNVSSGNSGTGGTSCAVSSYTPDLSTFCGNQSVTTNCGVITATGSLSCNNNCNFSTNSCCNISSYNTSLDSYCGTKSLTTNCGILPVNGTLSCSNGCNISTNLCNSVACTVSSYAPDLSTFCGTKTVTETPCGTTTSKNGTLYCSNGCNASTNVCNSIACTQITSVPATLSASNTVYCYSLDYQVVTGGATAFSFGGSNITLDCMGKTIYGTNGRAIDFGSASNIRVFNCKFDSFNQIYHTSSNYITLYNNMIRPVTTSAIQVIYLNNPYVNISNNVINLTSCGSKSCTGIYANNYGGLVFSNNIIIGAGTGIDVGGNTQSKTISGNNISNSGEGIVISSNSVVQNNKITNCSVGVRLVGSSSGSSISSNSVTGSSSVGLKIDSAAGSNVFLNNYACGNAADFNSTSTSANNYIGNTCNIANGPSGQVPLCVSSC